MSLRYINHVLYIKIYQPRVTVKAAWECTISCEKFVSSSATYLLYSYIVTTLIRTERRCIAWEPQLKILKDPYGHFFYVG